MRTKTTITGSFIAVDDAGQVHRVNEWTDHKNVSGIGPTRLERARREPVSQAFRLDNGNHVHFLDNETMLVVRTGRRLRRL